MKGILFDMDGVLLDAMPFHADAFQIAFRELVGLDIDKKDVYLLEGMPGPDLIKEILKKNGNSSYSDENIIKKIGERKKELFKKNENAKPFEGVGELLSLLKGTDCMKAVVSGASENEVKSLLKKNRLLESFDLVISGEDLEEGKPSPEPFVTALKKLDLDADDALVVENAPLGVTAAVNAGIKFIITLNNSPLKLDDFQNLPKDKGHLDKILFKDTKSAADYLLKWNAGSGDNAAASSSR
ncbi:MAG TPA: HAD family phosphatase [Candidatus Nitrosocosmicus sp.]|nr:HAD family phosphatase [Candidatus Nitrosocosmicus sp.]